MKLVHFRLATLLTLQAVFIFIHYLLFQIEDPVTVIVSNMALIALNMFSLNKVMLIISIWFSFHSLPKDHSWVKFVPYVKFDDEHHYRKCSKCGIKIAFGESYKEYMTICSRDYMKNRKVRSCREIVMDDALS